MARNEKTAADIDAIANEIGEAVTSLRSIATAMRESGLPFVLIHGTTQQNTHIPSVVDWAGKAQLDAKSQIRAYLNGVKSKAETIKQYAENQKMAAAKKVPKNPGTVANPKKRGAPKLK